MNNVLSIQGLTHRYGSVAVLSGLDLSLQRGELLGLLGPNGSGKSTVFSIIAGLLPLQGGAIEFEGQSIRDAGRALRMSMGVIFQSPSLDPRLTCRQNLQLAARLRGITGAESRKRVDEFLEMAALTDRADDAIKKLSGGMKRRLDLARALIHEPRLLLMDEPTSGLDEAAFRNTWERLDTMRAGRELSILVTTHRPEEGERCDRVAVLSGGKIIAVDAPQTLREQVAADVIVLSGKDPAALCKEAQSHFDFPCRVDGDGVVMECEKGHELIPRIVEAFPNGRLDSVSLRRPSLADVFLKMTGTGLDNEIEAAR